MSETESKKKSKIIMNHFLNLEFRANNFFVYVSKGKEVYTHDLIKKLWDRKNMVSVPKVIDDTNMGAHVLTDWSQLSKGAYGVLEPDTNLVSKVDICVLPGLLFDKKGGRLGSGKGYYDRFLNSQNNVLAVALAYDSQVFPWVPTERTDRLVDIIVTESRIILSSSRYKKSLR